MLDYLYWMCKEEQPENKQAKYQLNSPRLTSAQQNQSLGSRWPERANQWSAQRSCHGKCGWTSLLTNQKKRYKKTALLILVNGSVNQSNCGTELACVTPPPHLWCIWSSWRLQIRSFWWGIAADLSEISVSAPYCEYDGRTGSKRHCRLNILTHMLQKKEKKYILFRNFGSHIGAEKEH